MSSYPFGLSDHPFAPGHDNRLIYSYPRRIEAVTLLRRRIAEGASFVTVTGDSGCGKTSVVTEVLESGDLDAKVAFISHPSLTPSELLEAVCIEFDAPLPGQPSKPLTLASLEHHLRELRRQGHPAILVLDEAHGLKTELLEEARLLSNMKHEGSGLLQTVLVGLPELERRLGLPDLAQLRQRIAVHVRLQPLTPEETEGYVQHRIAAVGGDGPAMFPHEACEEIHAYTNGFPRDINTLAGRALEHAEQEGATSVTADHVRMAAGDARPGITTVQRASSGPQSFELKRKPSAPRVYEAARAPERPAEPEVVPKPPTRLPPIQEVRKPPSFLRMQQEARTGTPDAAGGKTQEQPTLETRFRRGEVTADELAAGADGSNAPAPAEAATLRDHVQELGASVILVGVLVVVLVMTGRWNPVAAPPGPQATVQQTQPAVATDPTAISTPGTGIVTGPNAAAPIPKIDPTPPPPAATIAAPPTPQTTSPPPGASGGASAGRTQAPSVPSGTGTGAAVTTADPLRALPADVPVAERWIEGAKQGYGFQVAATSVPDTAIALLRRIARGTKLPCRIVTKTTGETYRVVVGPFPTRREAQKAINDLFKTPIVKRAQLVQIPE